MKVNYKILKISLVIFIYIFAVYLTYKIELIQKILLIIAILGATVMIMSFYVSETLRGIREKKYPYSQTTKIEDILTGIFCSGCIWIIFFSPFLIILAIKYA